jgi:hypothetical protein
MKITIQNSVILGLRWISSGQQIDRKKELELQEENHIAAPTLTCHQ